jgi:hypothetical protein
VEYSEVGVWPEAELNILRKHAKAYSTILSKKGIFTHDYVDGSGGPVIPSPNSSSARGCWTGAVMGPGPRICGGRHWLTAVLVFSMWR